MGQKWGKAVNQNSQVTDMERAEDGIEPAMSSLGNWIAIENKTHRVHGGLSESTEKPEESKIKNNSCLNAAEMRQTFILVGELNRS